ncbi:MAG TPA: RNA polymerase sigma-I factor, partial [Firmicutes bacterium]|nr:RNA polymerase sigma-I factor [Bacillota bacterium]
MRPVLKRETPEESAAELDRMIREAQSGSREAREELIRTYLPFILKVASKVTRKYVRVGVDDEVSVSLMAFDEAISRYDARKGTSFLSFSEIVMRRRLADFFRRESPKDREVPLSGFAPEGDTEDSDTGEFVEERQAALNYASQVEAQERRDEIMRFQKALMDYGISFSDLVKASPRHRDARLRAMEVARVVVSQPSLREYLFQRRGLPLRELTRLVAVSRKTLERQRKYIIAIA